MDPGAEGFFSRVICAGHGSIGSIPLNPVIVLLAQSAASCAGTEDGQGMVEYGLIVALISIVVLVALSLVGGNIANAMNLISSTMANSM